MEILDFHRIFQKLNDERLEISNLELIRINTKKHEEVIESIELEQLTEFTRRSRRRYYVMRDRDVLYIGKKTGSRWDQRVYGLGKGEERRQSLATV